jgi:hypothetical protein
MEEIKFPTDFEERSDRALRQLGKYVAACSWCGHGYEDISPELQDEHLAYHCPGAPAELKEDARRRFTEGDADAPKKTARKEATSKRPCRHRCS